MATTADGPLRAGSRIIWPASQASAADLGAVFGSVFGSADAGRCSCPFFKTRGWLGHVPVGWVAVEPRTA